MTINAARLLRDGDVVFVGVGLPNLACNLARRTHAPNLTLVYEAGVVPRLSLRMSLSRLGTRWELQRLRLVKATENAAVVF